MKIDAPSRARLLVALSAALLQSALFVRSVQALEPAPVLNVDGVDGHRMVIRPAVLQKPLVLHFFSTQDPGWEEELLKLKEFDKRFGSKGVALVSFAAPGPGVREQAAAFAVKNHITFPIAVDAGNLSAFGRERVPRLVLITPDASTALRLYGPPGDAEIREIESRLPELLARRKELLEKALKGHPREREKRQNPPQVRTEK
jgi:hypothetical protein